jgi:hypothetical protein
MLLYKFKYLFISILFISFNIFAQDVKTYIPPQAYNHFDDLNKEIKIYWPDHPMKHYFGSLIEHESCISLTHSRCWNPKSRLKTSREEGAGFGQITRAYKSDGSIRFDALSELKALHPKELKEWNWGNVYTRSDLQLRAIVLKTKDNYNTLSSVKDPKERLYMTDVSYNQGIGRTKKDRQLCGLKKNCNPQIWFDNVEKSYSGTNKIIYGKRGPYDISRHHVRDVFNIRLSKYQPYIPGKYVEKKLEENGKPLSLKIDYKTLDEQNAFDRLIASFK